jgi:enolase
MGGMQMPVPMMNVINGGAHANNSLDLQEFMIIPGGRPELPRSLRWGAEVFHALKKIMHDKGMSTAVGDEGGFAPNVASHEAAIQLILQGHRPPATPRRADRPGPGLRRQRVLQGRQVPPGRRRPEADRPAMDRHAGHLGATSTPSSASKTAWPKATGTAGSCLTDRLGKKVQIVGDDLFVTNTKILKEGIDKGIANSILIKINQIGTLTETFAAIEMAKRAGYTAVISHRSGETEDSTIADIAVGTNAGQIKTGSLSRSDRIAKYNQLLRIEEDLGDVASYPGRARSTTCGPQAKASNTNIHVRLHVVGGDAPHRKQTCPFWQHDVDGFENCW